MGIPFQAGIREIETRGFSAYIPWAWAVNGSTSVVSAVLAAFLALSFGFNWVLRLGALCYAGAIIIVKIYSGHQGVKEAERSIPSPVNGTNETPPML